MSKEPGPGTVDAAVLTALREAAGRPVELGEFGGLSGVGYAVGRLRQRGHGIETVPGKRSSIAYRLTET